jgi:EAL domain-containing protein (putative c-di-GMP-specific phosphodiesterase class I)
LATSLLIAAVGVALLVPLTPVWGGPHDTAMLLAISRTVAGCAAVVAAFALIVQSMVSSNRELVWLAGGFGLVYLLVLARAGGRSDADLVEGLSLVTALAVPLCALTAGLARRSPALLLVPALAVAVAGAAVVATRPDLLTGDELTTGTRAAWVAIAVVAAAAAARCLRPGPPSRRWVGAGLCVAALAALLRASAQHRLDDLWWAAVDGEDLSLLVPALGIGLRSVAGYGRQSRRWRQLEAEVKALRRGSRLLEGRSVTPEDDEGLPGPGEVRAILDAAAVRVALQPVIELPTGNTVGSEALSRFGGRVPTDRWFKAASKHGLGAELERLTLGAALALLPGLPAEQFLAVNISPAALADAEVLALLHAADLHRVVVEITEHEAVADYALVRRLLGELRAAGARIAVDDTGAGFASLRHVLMLQPDIIKLDLSLTRDVDVDRRQQALVRAVTAFAAQVGTVVLAEGVETQEQLDTLRDIGVRLGQGWHLGVPVLAT